jgi:hypothetical protein
MRSDIDTVLYSVLGPVELSCWRIKMMLHVIFEFGKGY